MLVYGNLSLVDVTDTFAIPSTIKNIVASKRFDGPCFNPCDKKINTKAVRLFYFHFYFILW